MTSIPVIFDVMLKAGALQLDVTLKKHVYPFVKLLICTFYAPPKAVKLTSYDDNPHWF